MDEHKPLKKLYEIYEPYHYFSIYLDAHRRLIDEYDASNKPFQSKTEELAQRNFLYRGKMALSNPAFRILKIDEDLLPIIEDTKPDYKDLKLKYPAMFINHQIQVGNSKVNGFLLLDCDQLEGEDKLFGFVRDGYTHPIMVLYVCYDYDLDFEFYSIGHIDKNPSKDQFYLTESKERKQMQALGKRVRELACNLMNILVHDQKEVQEVTVCVRPGQNEKRAKRGKLPLRDITYLRLGGTLKKYATEYNKLRSKQSIRYHVGGFFRNLTAERYTVKRKVYIKPFWKGMEHMPDVTKKYVWVENGRKKL